MNDLTGMRFGRLVAIENVGSSPRKRRLWKCICDCGKETVVESTALKLGGTKSCGCLVEETRVTSNIKHGDCGTRLYRIWKGILARCKNKGSSSYRWYGAKGVTVCDEWSKYENFKEWAINNGYSDTLTIDRINPYLNYNPENCRWVTMEVQRMNKRRDYDAKRIS